MPYSISEQVANDIDWYFVDHQGALMHLTSAGGRLPDIVVERNTENDLINRVVNTLPEQFEVEINQELDGIVLFEDQNLRALYLEDFVAMAKRGLFSYDKTVLGDFNEPRYHLVAGPKEGFLKAELLPENLRSLLFTSNSAELAHTNSTLNIDGFQ